MDDRWNPPDLAGQVAVVTGASKGVGRGVAEVLAQCGATVVAAARTIAERPVPGCISVPCDLDDDDQVAALFAEVEREHGRLDVLVNNAVGWADAPEPATPFLTRGFWETPEWWWDVNFRVGVRSHFVATRHGVPLMRPARRGLVLFTSERRPPDLGMQELVLDLRATVVERMVEVMAFQLRRREIAAVLLYPGWTRTEDIVAAVESGERGLTMEELIDKTASPQYAGRAAATLATEANVLERSGRVVTTVDVARQYGFTDIDGRQPDPV